MIPVQNLKASVGLDGASDRGWFAAIGEELRLLFGRRTPTTREAASVMGRAAAAKRERDNRTYEEKKADFHAKLRAERDGGWPVSPSLINKELAR